MNTCKDFYKCGMRMRMPINKPEYYNARMRTYIHACMQVVLAIQREMITLTFDIRDKNTKTIRIV